MPLGVETRQGIDLLVSLVEPQPQVRFLHQDTITAAVQSVLGAETFLQFLHGGAVARARLDQDGDVGTLLPGEFRRFHYDVVPPGIGGTITARLLFRALPPYFLRALAKGQQGAGPDLSAAMKNLEIVEMARDEVRF